MDPSTQQSGRAEETKETMDEETVGPPTKETGTEQANSLMQATGDTLKDPMDVDSSPSDKEPSKEVLLMCASGGSRCILHAAADSTKHKCPACHKAVHAICGEVDEDACLLYKTTCWPCFDDTGRTLSGERDVLFGTLTPGSRAEEDSANPLPPETGAAEETTTAPGSPTSRTPPC